MKKKGKRGGLLVLIVMLLLVMAVPGYGAEKTTGRWKKDKTGKYYVKENGALAKGSYKIGSTYYVFNDKGKLCTPKKDSLVTVGKNTYYVSKSGKAISGWQLIKNKLYYAQKNGKIKKNTTYQGIPLTKSGYAKTSSIYTKNKIAAMKAVASVTKKKMSKSQKLRACWNYVTGGSFRYAPKYPNLNKKGWQLQTAVNMLTTHSGNCYSFACAFASLACEVGYKNVYVVCGRVPGSRDHAGDGYTRHAWVKINGRYYDPEAQYAGWMRGVYGSGGYPISHSVQKTVNFSK